MHSAAGLAPAADWQPVATLQALQLRARLFAWLREFMAQRSVLEVHTPVLSAAANSDPQIESFSSTHLGPLAAGAAPRYLRTSPEFALKRLLCAGIGDCYELGPVFRNGEFGTRHNPEFTMLEWYRVGIDHHQLAEEVIELVCGAMQLVERPLQLRRSSYRELFQQALDIDPCTTSEEQLRQLASRHCGPLPVLDRDGLLDLLLSHLLIPGFPDHCLTLITEYPATQAALARVRPGNPPLAERFEVFVGSHELANGYHELKDGSEQRQRFERDLARRAASGQVLAPLDTRLLAALQQGLPDCAGVALGVDRLLQKMLAAEAIRECMAFPFERA